MKIKTSEIKELLRNNKLIQVINPTKQYKEAEESLAKEISNFNAPQHVINENQRGMQFIYTPVEQPKPNKKKRTRNPKVKWEVSGQFCGTYTNVNNAKWYAKQASKLNDAKKSGVYMIDDGLCYIEYENGKCVKDIWTKKRVKK